MALQAAEDVSDAVGYEGADAHQLRRVLHACDGQRTAPDAVRRHLEGLGHALAAAFRGLVGEGEEALDEGRVGRAGEGVLAPVVAVESGHGDGGQKGVVGERGGGTGLEEWVGEWSPGPVWVWGRKQGRQRMERGHAELSAAHALVCGREW